MTRTASVASWNDYRRRVRWFIAAWLGGGIAATMLAVALSRTSAGAWAPMTVGAVWIVFFALAAAHLQLFRCPRCNQQFFKATWYYWPLAGRCVHCGLPKWQA